MAGDLLASSVQCDARSLEKTLLLGTSAEYVQNILESVTPEHSLPGTALTALHLTLSDLTLQLLAPPQTSHPLSAVWWPYHLGPCPYLSLCPCPWLAAP